jgi:hypothetical protein
MASFTNLTHDDGASCQKDGQCQIRDCCSKRTHGTLKCGVGLCEPVCEKVVSIVINKLATEGCALVIPEGTAVCQAIGLGPEEPLSDVCTAVVVIGCPIIARDIAKGVRSPKQICSDIGVCKHTGSRCGCLKDGQCADSTGDCCTHKSHHTAACPEFIRCGAAASVVV